MRRTPISATMPGAPLAGALALSMCLCSCLPCAPARADEAPADTASAETSAQAASTDEEQAATEASSQESVASEPASDSASAQASTVVAQGLSVRSYSTDAAASDPAMAELNAQNTLTVHAKLSNETSQVDDLYAAINAARTAAGLAEVARDGELEQAAYQRAAESYLAHSDVRPDATLFNTACARSTGEILVWGNSADDTSAQAVLDELSKNDNAAAHSWLLSATNVGVGCVSDDDGNVYWAIEVSFDSAATSESGVAQGQADYAIAAAAANVAGIALPERLEMKSGESTQAVLEATVEGTLSFGVSDYGYSYEFTGAKVTVDTANFTWNSADTSIVRVTKDGTLTAVAAGTVTISSTDADGSNPRFGGVVVDGGAASAAYDLADCTLVGLTGDDGRGNFYLNDQGSVDVPTFSVMASDGTVIDPVNYTVSISYNERTSIAVLSVKANSKSEVCSGIVTRQLNVVDPNAQTATDTQAQDSADSAATGEQASDQDTDTAGASGDAGQDGAQQGQADQNEQDEASQDATQQDQQTQTGEDQDSASAGQAGESQDGPDDQQETLATTKSIQSGQLTLSFGALTYTGAAVVASSSTLTVDGSQLTEGTDYTLSYESNVDAGTAKAVATGTGAYSGTLETSFTISPADISQASVTMPNLPYTGGAMNPQPTLVSYTSGSGTYSLEAGVDYEVVGYSSNVNVGDATVVLRGIGNYTGTLTANWKIVEQGTTNAGTTQTIPKTADPTDLGAAGIAALCGAAGLAGGLALLRRRGGKTATER